MTLNDILYQTVIIVNNSCKYQYDLFIILFSYHFPLQTFHYFSQLQPGPNYGNNYNIAGKVTSIQTASLTLSDANDSTLVFKAPITILEALKENTFIKVFMCTFQTEQKPDIQNATIITQQEFEELNYSEIINRNSFPELQKTIEFVNKPPLMRPVLKKLNHLRALSLNIHGLTEKEEIKTRLILSIITNEDPDVICIQETKCSAEDVIRVAQQFYDYELFNSQAKLIRKNYFHGTATLVKKKISAQQQLITDQPRIIAEGRITTILISNLAIINVYSPYSLNNYEFRAKFDSYLQNYHQQFKQAIILGDLNVTPINYKEHCASCTDFEISNFNTLKTDFEAVLENSPTVFGWNNCSQVDHILVKGVRWAEPRVLSEYFRTGSDHIPVVVDVKVEEEDVEE
ncbi:exodeoxyribonuclease_III [Hexamita inflata]|uniref:Exodeoxyribonuclease III n=1 Tax=Hexamita inflata TaxID=28002 RepID=A0AA86Q8G8_9EUKA|nr:exodeoxyribonuclease III [Hexamita inflata]